MQIMTMRMRITVVNCTVHALDNDEDEDDDDDEDDYEYEDEEEDDYVDNGYDYDGYITMKTHIQRRYKHARCPRCPLSLDGGTISI